MKKKFCPSFTIPVYKQGYRSFIEFWATAQNGQYKRFRPTFNLNRIHHLPTRHERGRDLCAKIRWWLEQGYPVSDFAEERVIVDMKRLAQPDQSGTSAKKKNKPIEEALDIALRLKHNPEKPSTNKSFESHVRRFLAFLKSEGYVNLKVNQVSKSLIHEYLDYYKIQRKVRNNTLNNVITHLKAIFYTLKEREYVEENPFVGVKLYKGEEKIRRNFSKEEARVVLSEVYQSDRVLFYSILLIYACLIRPSELRRLRFWDIDLKNYLVGLDGKRTKSGHERTATIPSSLHQYFEDDFWYKYPGSYLIFGKGCEPHPSLPCGKGSLYRRHEKLLKRLHAEGKLSNIHGLQYYSWKDTGITDIIESLGLMVAFDQAGHRDVKDTMRYRHANKINHKVRGMDFDLLGAKASHHSRH